MTPAVASGRMVTDLSPLSVNVYISFCTTSVSSPMPRAKISVRSRMGVRSSLYPQEPKTRRAVFSIWVKASLSGENRSAKPFILLTLDMCE